MEIRFRNKAFRMIWSVCLLIGLSFSGLLVARATTPNPGHPWAGVGDGVFAITGPSILRTFTFPDADATVLTSLTNDFDRATAGALTFGNTNATSVSVCNSLACDTVDIATNADADTVTIGDALDSVALASANWSITAPGVATFSSLGLTGDLDLATHIITNIGNTGTDFVATTGALNLAGVLTANGGIIVAANQNFTIDAGTGTATFTSTGGTSFARNLFSSGTNVIAAQFGSGSTSGFTADQYGGAVRFNGSGVAWGDMSYYPNGGASGSQGNFRLSTTGGVLATTPSGKLGIGELYSVGNVGIGTAAPTRILDIVGGSPRFYNSTTPTYSSSVNLGVTALDLVNRAANGSVSGLHVYMSGTNSGTFLTSTASSTGFWSSGARFHGSGLYVPTETTATSIMENAGAIQFLYGTGLTPGTTTALTESMRISTTGNVGIGTTTPTKQLTFGQVAADPIQIRRDTTSQGNPAVGTGISWTWNNAAENDNTWAAIRAIMPGSTNSHLTFSTTPVAGGAAGLLERMRIEDSGDVGIGDATPASMFTVGNGDLFQVNSSGAIAAATGIITSGAYVQTYTGTGNAASITSTSTTNGSKGLIIQNTGAVTGTGYGGMFIKSGVSTTNVGLYASASGGTNNYAAIFDAGYVGIGTASPIAKLNIQGSWAQTLLDGDNVVIRKPNYAGGGWARTLMNFQEYDGTTITSLGALGTNNTFVYGFIGAAYNDAAIQWYPDKTVTLGGNVTTVGSVGIGDTTPASMLTVGNGDLFQVNSSGAIAAATGIITSGQYAQTFAGTTTAGATITANSLTTGTALIIPHTTSVIASGGSLIRASSSSVDTSTTTGTLLDLASTGSTAGTIALITNNTALFTGISESISNTGLTTGTGLAITGGSTITTNGELVNLDISTSTAGQALNIQGTGNYAGTGLVSIVENNSSMTSGIGLLLSNVVTGGNTNSPLISLQGNGYTAIGPTNITGAFTLQTIPSNGSAGKLMIAQTGWGVAAANDLSISETGAVVTRGGVTTGAGTPDIAENVPVSDLTLEKGDVMALDTSATGDGSLYNNFKAKKSQSAYDSQLLGVVSTSPGLILNGPDNVADENMSKPNERLLALAGRVPVKVSDQNGPVKQGDYLTSSSTPGVAMKATHAGAVIGQALENWDTTSGKTQVLISVKPGYYNGESLNEVAGTSDQILAKLLADQTSGGALTASAELLTGRIAAGLEIITPSITSKGLRIDNITALNDIISFQSDIAFIGRPFFNKDTGGFAVIHTGDTSVHVAFEKPYIATPVVQASVTFDELADPIAQAQAETDYFASGTQLIITRKSLAGFTIMLNVPTTKDLKINWLALAITDARTDESVPTSTAPVTASINPVTTIDPAPSAPTTTIDPALTTSTTTTVVDPTASTSTTTTVTDPTAVVTDPAVTAIDPALTTTTATVVDPTATTVDPTLTTTSTTVDPTVTTVDPAPAPAPAPDPAPAPAPDPAPVI
ncbi:MAG: hypothetical protein WC802_03365 [Patescibacteria group bacterium]|jgi:hypothetical protein